jgi:hypothetical protein
MGPAGTVLGMDGECRADSAQNPLSLVKQSPVSVR